MFRATVFRCPNLKESNDGTRCDAALCIAENNLIKNIADVDISWCINKKRRYEACYIYWVRLRMAVISKMPVEVLLLHDSRPHAFGSL